MTGRPRQRIEGWGTSLIGPAEPLVYAPGLARAEVARLDRLVFSAEGINLVRVFGPGQPGTGEVSVWSPSDPMIRFMKRVRGYGVRFAFTGGGAPLPMRGGNSATGALEPGSEVAYARFLAGNLEVASEAGVPFDWAGIGNETDISGAFWVPMHPGQAAAVYRELAAQIRQRGLGTRLMLGDNQGWGRTYEYARLALESGPVSSLASIVATHPYSDAEPLSMRRLARFADRRRLSLWMTEWSIGCPPCGGDTGDIETAIRFANQITYDLNVGQVQAWFTFPAVRGMDGANGAIVAFPPGSSRSFYTTQRFPVIRQFTSAARPGARRYETLVSDPALRAVAFRRGQTTTVVVTNDAPLPRTAALGIDRGGGILRSRRTSQQEDFRRLPTRRYDGTEVQVRLPGLSVTTFRLIRR